MPTRFIFKPIREEIRSKIESMLTYSDGLEKNLLNICRSQLRDSEISKIQRSLNYIKSVGVTSPLHPPFKLYTNHLLRVATCLVRMRGKISADYIIISLMHNILEVGGISEKDLKKAGYKRSIIRGVRLLTIDRKKEKEENLKYLLEFHQDIEDYGTDLALIRCLDKLDNLLGLERIERDEKRLKYIDSALSFEAPMAHRISRKFGDYFVGVANYMKGARCKINFKKKYERLLPKGTVK